MTPDPYQRLLAKMVAEREAGPTTESEAAFWQRQAERYAQIADEMLREWRKMYPLAHPRKHDGPMGD